MMTLDEMKLAVCEKLPEKIGIVSIANAHYVYWLCDKQWTECTNINWPTEGLQVCHEAEKLIDTQRKWSKYHFQLRYVICAGANINKQLAAYDDRDVATATYEQRLKALCRVWWPERFN